MDSLIDIFAKFKSFGQRPALIVEQKGGKQVFSYANVYSGACVFAAHLKSLGVAQGDKVVLCAPNSANWVFAYWGVFAAGAVLVPLDYHLPQEEIFKLAEFCGAKAVLTSNDFEAATIPTINILKFNFSEETENFILPKIALSNLAEIVFTSGTTGEPKGVALSHGNISANIKQLAQAITVNSESKFLATLTFSIMLQQTAGLLVPWSVGGCVILPENYTGEKLLLAWEQEKVSIIVFVPVILQRIIERLLSLSEQEKNSLLKELKLNFEFFVCGGTAVPENLTKFWQDNNFTILEGYGLTECSPVLTANLPGAQKPQTVGRALPGVSLQIQEGEILAKGENIFAGYYNNPKATAEVFTKDGWFKTGDLGDIDSQGFVKLFGRREDVINTVSGQTFFPEEIEKVFLSLKGIKEVCVAAEAGAGGVKLVATVIMDGRAFDQAEILNQANQLLAKDRQVETVSLWPYAMLPRTALGKLQRYKINRRLSFGLK